MFVGPGPAPGMVRKQAGSAADRARLSNEIKVLDAARHPGVVELVRSEPDDERGAFAGRQSRDRPPEALVLRAVAGGSLADVGPLTPAETAAIGAATATILADLHDVGVVHGSVEPSHVLLDTGRRPVLCSLGRGRCPGRRDGPSPADDVAALGAMLTSLIGPSDVPRAMMKALARAMHTTPRRRPSARRMAASLAALSDPHPDPRRVAPKRLIALAVTAVAVATSIMAVAVTTDPPWPSVVPGVACPAVDAGCLPLSRPGGVVVTANGGYRVGGPGDQVVLGRWRCNFDARLALLRPSSGQVWAFDEWAGQGRTVAGRLVATVPGAVSLRVVPSTSGCDRLVVFRRSARPVTISVPPAGAGQRTN